ncbi:MAG: hypothetical protein HY318_16060 [Armatimonadetes bacterium]|nr:hypothetical protein [Armatimonadota bacterium]
MKRSALQAGETKTGDENRRRYSEWLGKASPKDKDPKVAYCERIRLHRDELADFGNVQAMVVPFSLK